MLAIALVVGMFAVPQSALAAPGDPTISTSPALTPSFDPSVTNYVAKCGTSTSAATTVTVSVTAPAGTTVSVDGASPKTGTFTASLSRAWGQGFAFTVIVGGGSPTTYHVRCLPTDFPAFSVQRSGSTQAEYYVLALANSSTGTYSYITIVDTNGVPVWWYRPALRATYADLLADGNLAWAMFAPGGTDVRSLSGSLVTNLNSPDNPPSDPHEAQLLPNGNYLLVVYPTVSGVDLSSIGGSSDTCIKDAEVEEITPAGALVRSWFASDHVSPTEINANIWARARTSSCTTPQDIWHLNSADDHGTDFIVSLRYTGVYRVNWSTGNIVWKLGGTTTPQSLTIVDDPATPAGGLGQHDARLNSDGSVSMFDNGNDGNGYPNLRAPRAVRYTIDTSAVPPTATMVEQITDPAITTPAACCGSARRLPGGNWVIGWGSNNTSTEVTSTGTRILSLTGPFTYRAIPVLPGTLDAGALRAGMDAMNPNPPSWRVVAAPRTGSTSRFTATAALRDDDVWAAGSYTQGGVDWPLLDHWNGTSWQVLLAPRAGSASRFTSISALPTPTAADDVWAAGSYTRAGVEWPLLDHWNGTSWQVLPAPHAGSTSRLTSVSASSSYDVWAAGSYTQGGVEWPLLDHWNGSSWQVVPGPHAGSTGRFTSVSALGASDVWAAGSYTQGGVDRSILDHWNGTSWQLLPAPQAGSASRFTSVSTSSGGHVFAAGSYTQNGVDWAFVDHWNGTSWQVLVAPHAGSGSQFTSVSALGATDVWAGGSFIESGVNRPFVDHWNGTSWQVLRAPKTGTASSFASISALSATDVWAAGSYTQGGVDWPVVEQYAPGPT
ncbi:MAG TPA: arylsulfotransferase family protein [Acidimicrobiia bacterium]|nr:arylsulfotransferase family protein [Acidimicrobiia bacterium]